MYENTQLKFTLLMLDNKEENHSPVCQDYKKNIHTFNRNHPKFNVHLQEIKGYMIFGPTLKENALS